MTKSIREKILCVRQWEDRQRSLLGKVLLVMHLKQLGYDASVLDKLSYDSYGRPHLPLDFDFSISHSGNYVTFACVFQGWDRLGGDKAGCHVRFHRLLYK